MEMWTGLIWCRTG